MESAFPTLPADEQDAWRKFARDFFTKRRTLRIPLAEQALLPPMDGEEIERKARLLYQDAAMLAYPEKPSLERAQAEIQP